MISFLSSDGNSLSDDDLRRLIHALRRLVAKVFVPEVQLGDIGMCYE